MHFPNEFYSALPAARSSDVLPPVGRAGHPPPCLEGVLRGGSLYCVPFFVVSVPVTTNVNSVTPPRWPTILSAKKSLHRFFFVCFFSPFKEWVSGC